MAAEAFRGRGERIPIGGLGIVGLVGAGLSAALLWNRNAPGMSPDAPVIVADNFGLFVTMILVVVGILTIMFSSQVVRRDGLPEGEYYSLVLFAIAGMIMMATANDLLVIFIALEILSLSVYVLTGVWRDDMRGTEAAFKYFLLGAFSSAFFLYGIAFTFGLAESTRLDVIRSDMAAQSMSGNPMILLAGGLLLVGFAFKISAVPFHMWTPDAYEGAPAIVTGFMSTAVKAAAFAAFARVFLSPFEPFTADWAPVLWILAAATMILGTVVGVAQSNLKRMLAYSSTPKPQNPILFNVDNENTF
jgi:NADH-quinone oxidoreductase subunit N